MSDQSQLPEPPQFGRWQVRIFNEGIETKLVLCSNLGDPRGNLTDFIENPVWARVSSNDVRAAAERILLRQSAASRLTSQLGIDVEVWS